ncbi:hypothetical protein ACH4E8_04315 [Streptomyces sp. NPDC017979]|uniref:hypothetical protein n=1 Tax=Streptomyces sp. NPDC017979 TaxID=3365024 RepID=UPI003794BE31
MPRPDVQFDPTVDARTPGVGPAGGDRPRRRYLHPFRLGKALAGQSVLAAAVLFAGDAADAWHTPWFVVFPVVFGGLLLAGTVGTVHYVMRRRRSAISASTDSTGAPPSSSGSQAIR